MTSSGSFSATGRPTSSANPQYKADNFAGLTASDSFGASPGNLLPIRFDDDSVISVPVLPPQLLRGSSPSSPSSTTATPNDAPRRRSLFSRSKSTASKQPEFVIRQMTRREYLAHYAKDETGKYIGTQDPADDCILKGEDATRLRPKEAWRNEISEVAKGMEQSVSEKVAAGADVRPAEDGRERQRGTGLFGRSSKVKGGDGVIR